MPPQTPTQTPGEDVLLDTLRRSNISDDQRQQIWNAYHTSGDEKAFVGGLNQLNIHDDAKQTLYDMRFKGFKNPPTVGPEAQKAQTQTPAAPAQSSPQPGILDKAAALIFGGPDTQRGQEAQALMHGDLKRVWQLEQPRYTGGGVAGMVGAGRDKWLDQPQNQFAQAPEKVQGIAAWSSTDPYAQAHPIVRAVHDVAASLTSPENIAMVMGTGGLGEAGPAANAAFKLQMIQGGVRGTKATADAYAAGDVSQAKYEAATATISMAMAAHGGLTGERPVQPVSDFRGGAYGEATPKGPQAPLVYNSEAVAGVATAPKPTPEKLAGSLRAENADLKTRMTTAQGPDKAVIQQRMDENHQLIAEYDRQGLAPTAAMEAIAPQPFSLRNAQSPMRPYDPTGTRFAKGDTIGIKPFEMPIESSQAPLRVYTDDKMGVKWAEDPVTKNKVSIPSRIADADVESYARPKIEEQIQGRAQLFASPAPKTESPFAGPSDRNYIDSVITGQREPISTEIRNIQQRMDAMRPTPVAEPTVQAPRPVADGLPDQIKSNIDNMVRLGSMAQGAQTLEQKSAIESRRAEVASETNQLWREHKAAMTDPQRISLVGQLQDEISKHNEQAKVIRGIVADQPKVQALRDAMAEGRPVIDSTRTSTQLTKTKSKPNPLTPGKSVTIGGGRPIAIIDGMPFDARQAVHELMGSKMGKEFNEKEIARRATLRDKGLDPETVQPEGYRRMSQDEFKQTKDAAEIELKDLQGKLKKQVLDYVSDQADKNPSKVAEMGQADFAESMQKEAGRKVITPEAKERITELRRIVGWDPEKPLYLGKGEPVVDQQGVIKPAGDIGEKTLKMAQQIFGKKLNKIPEDTAWENRAQQFEARAGMLQKLVDSLKAKPREAKEAGFSTPQVTGSQVAGAAVGGAVGYHFAGPTGAAIGAGVGYMGGGVLPTVLKNSLSRIGPLVSRFNIPARDWLLGPKQEPAIGQTAQDILSEQRKALLPPGPKFLQRVAQLPLDAQRHLMDSFALISDRQGLLTNLLSRWDERGGAYRDLRGKLTAAQSPYVAARLALGGMMGKLEDSVEDYKDIVTEAQKAGKQDQLDQYLNLKGYQRAWDVVHEKVAENQQKVQVIDQMLNNQNFKLSTEQKASLIRDRRDITSSTNEMSAKMGNGEVAPKGYTPQSIQAELGQMATQLGQHDFGMIQNWAGRVFAKHSAVLDMLHDSGIVSSQDYQRYQARGAEYVPMHRILEDISQNNKGWEKQGAGSPLYLRQQNVIRELTGSEKTNVSPIIASAKANLEALREVTRNQAIQSQLDLAAADPSGVGRYFKQVPNGYQAKAGEGLVGVYKNGQAVTYATPDWLSETLKHASPLSVDSALTAIPKFFSNLLKKGATGANIGFSITNAITSLQSLALLSDAGLNFKKIDLDAIGLTKAMAKAVKSIYTRDSDWSDFVKSGAAGGTLQHAITPELFINPERLGLRGKIDRATPIESIAKLNAASQEVFKLTAYKRMLDSGASKEAAAMEARNFGGTPDYSRQGALSPLTNLVSMFFNAHLQHVSRVFQKVEDNPQRMGIVFGALTAMALMQAQWNHTQSTVANKPLWKMVPVNDKESNFIFLTGETDINSKGAEVPQYYKIKKPDFVRFLYNPIENVVSKMAGAETRTGTQIGLDALNALIPGQGQLKQGELGKSAARTAVGSLNPIIKLPIEQAMNMDMRTGAPIIPGRQQGIDSRFQVSPTTPAVLQTMGEGGVRGTVAGAAVGSAIGGWYGGGQGAVLGGAVGAGVGAMGLSPERLTHFVRGSTAGAGETAMSIGGAAIGAKNQQQQFPFQGQEAIRNQAVVGPAITSRFVGTPVNQIDMDRERDFYSNVQKYNQFSATFKYLLKSGDPRSTQYLTANKTEIAVGNAGEGIAKRIGTLNTAIQDLQKATNIPDKERFDNLRDLNQTKQILMDTYKTLITTANREAQK